MKQKLLLFMLFFCIIMIRQSVSAQTTLSPGQLLFTGFDSSYSPSVGDEVSFVCLVNLAGGTTINFTDRGYSDAGVWINSSSSEGTVKWVTGPNVIPAGTEIVLKGLKAFTYNLDNASLTLNGVVTLTDGTMVNGLSLSTVGDQVVAFQGGGNIVTGNGVTLIAGIHYYNCPEGTTQQGWDNPVCADGTNGSTLPPGLVGGSSAFYTGGAIQPVAAKFNIGSGALVNTPTNLIASVMNPVNWTFSETSLTMPSRAPFLVALTEIGTQPISKTVCSGSNTTFSVIATGTVYLYQWEVDTHDGAGFVNITNTVPYSGATSASLNISNITSSMSGNSYRVKVTGSGFVTSNEATLSVPASLSSYVESQSNVSTYGGSNGFATLQVSGGTMPYFYSWSPSGQTGGTANNLSAGTYTVTITDSTPNGIGGCTTTQTVNITQPAGILVSTNSLNPFSSCPGVVSATQSFTFSAGSLTSSMQVSAPSGYEIGQYPTGFFGTNLTYSPSGGDFNNVALYVRLSNYASGTPSGNITLSTFGATTQNIAVTGSILTAPAITAQPSDVSICAGENTTFYATASYATGYQWQVNNGDGFLNIINDGVYSGANTGTLTITEATVEMNGLEYRVMALGQCFPVAISNNAILTVNSGPFITGQPSYSSICNGNNALFYVAASNATAYQWEVDSGSGFTAITNNAVYSGVTSKFLTVSNAPAEINGFSYRVRVSGDCSSFVYSSNAIITVNSNPVFSEHPANSTVCKGLNTTFYAAASYATAYQWQVNQGAGFMNISNSGVYSGANTATLTITGATAEMNGLNYRVIAMGDCFPTATSNNAILTVNSGPFITEQPNSEIICAGENTTFMVVASNASGYQWQVDQGAGFSSISNNGIYSGANGTTLTITGVTEEMNGFLYRVVANGSCFPTVTSNNAALTVNSASKITSQPVGRTICEGENTTFTATVNNAVSYQWQVNQGFGYSNIGSGGPYTGETTATLTISNATSSLNGFKYRLVTSGTCFPAALSSEATLTINNRPQIITNPASVMTCNGSNAIFSVDALGAGNYQWQVNQGAGFMNISNGGLYSGATTDILTITGVTTTMNNYAYRVVAIGICSPPATSSAAFLIIPSISHNSTQSNVSCNGAANGSISVSPSEGSATYSYLWSNSATTSSISNLTPGNYDVTITDENSCQKTIEFTIIEPTSPLSADSSSTPISCYGGSNGTATVNVSGGTPGYFYSWAPYGGSNATATGLEAGTYTVTITDANECVLTKNVTVGSPGQFSGSITKTDVSCNTGSNGFATITVTGATFPYTYSWTPYGGTGATATGLAAGTFNVLITDANGCVYQESVTIGENAPISYSQSQTNVLCKETATGTAKVIASGGTGSYTYLWSPYGGTNATATGLVSGNYSVLITDSNGCNTVANFVITEPSELSAAKSQTNATCTTSGDAKVTPNGGTAPYSYLWSDGQTTSLATELDAGNYSVIVTDAKGCTITENFTLSTINTLVASQTQVDVLCNSGNTGSASVVPSGAVGPFTYVWSPSGGNADTASGLTAGNYSVSITAANGCSIVKNFTIIEPDPITIIPSQTNVSCNRGSNGTATVNVSGGTPDYNYSWAPYGGANATATDLEAGTYTVTITDANLCTATQTITITEPDAIVVTPAQTNVSCYGGSNGTASVSVTGGTGIYTYSWSPSGGSTDTATGLTAGIYTVSITDENACNETLNIIISEPAILAATISKTDVSCNGAADGSATTIVTGGTGIYTYSWSPTGGTDATVTGLAPGTYTANITDGNGCFITQTVIISTTPDETAPVPNVTFLPEISNYCSVLASQITVPTATDNCIGLINATTTDDLNYTVPGIYTITWHYDDSNGNTSSQQQTIIVEESPLADIELNDLTTVYNGSVQKIMVENLPADATVSYSITPQAEENNGALNAGTYTVTAIVSPSVLAINCEAVTLTAELVIEKAAQNIQFNELEVVLLEEMADFQLMAEASSGLAIDYTYTYNQTTPAAIVTTEGWVEILHSGSIQIIAHQVGNNNYLPAVSVEHTLVIESKDASIQQIVINGTVYDNPDETIYYTLDCKGTSNEVTVQIGTENGAIVSPANDFVIVTPKPGIYRNTIEVISQNGEVAQTYQMIVERPFAFDDIVVQKFDNTLLVNNNPQTNGGYRFAKYEWYRNDVMIGTEQVYSVGNSNQDLLDENALYSVILTTENGDVIHTCAAEINRKHNFKINVYPNPVRVNEQLQVVFDYPASAFKGADAALYTTSGKLIQTVKLNENVSSVQLPAGISEGIYILVLQIEGIQQTIKVVVKQ